PAPFLKAIEPRFPAILETPGARRSHLSTCHLSPDGGSVTQAAPPLGSGLRFVHRQDSSWASCLN
ncbi:MAG: hypothetical protein ACOYOZ_12320, partial [Pirellula sp.]